ncbi:MAG: winged helix-turn-helix domain-containing protein [Pseudomonadota bacterium]
MGYAESTTILSDDFYLGRWLVSPPRCLVIDEDAEQRVSPRSMAVLKTLADARGEVVTRETLFDAVWPNAEVSDDALTQCIGELRRAFGDQARNSRQIETIPKVGFRVIEPVRPAAEAQVDAVRAPARSIGRWSAAAITLLALLVAAAALSDRWSPPAAPAADAHSIVVLPFVDQSPVSGQGWIATGLTEELINALSRLSGLLVIGPVSSFHYQDTSQPAENIAESLNVDHVLQGTVQRHDDALRIWVQLLDTRTGETRWSRTYEEERPDIFEVQNDIARSVAEVLSVSLGIGELGRLTGMTRNVEAFEAVMSANELHDGSVSSWYEAESRLKRATEMDPEFGLAWAQLASLYRSARWTLDDFPWREEADNALIQAFRYAPDSVHVHLTAAFIRGDSGQWLAVQEHLDSAISLSHPAHLGVRSVAADVFIKLGRATEALPHIEFLLAREPLAGYRFMYRGQVYAMLGRQADARRAYEDGLAAPHKGSSVVHGGLVHALGTGDRAEQERWLDRSVAMDETEGRQSGFFHASRRLLGQRDEALADLRQRFEQTPGGDVDYWIAVFAAFYGDADLSVRALDRSRDFWSVWTPVMANVRATDQFANLMETAGLVEYWDQHGWGEFCERDVGGTVRCR